MEKLNKNLIIFHLRRVSGENMLDVIATNTN